MSVFASAALWNGIVRVGVFWSLFAAGLLLFALCLPFSNWPLVVEVLGEVGTGANQRVASRDFAFALSSGIVQVALALALAMFLAHVVLLRVALQSATRALGHSRDVQAFASQFDAVSQKLDRNAVVGPAWREFRKTTVREDGAIQHTVRPQHYINLTDARERLFGLKMMGAIPGFFVGLGLLLTFIGLVLALNKAAASTGVASADAMTGSLNELLAAATFKFSTSIAGLGASLTLALLFRTYQIWIEGGFYKFSRALEDRMLFQSSHQIATDSRRILAEQRDQLKEINSADFFARLGQSVAPKIEGAIAAALHPVTAQLDTTMGQLRHTSQSGLQDVLEHFLLSLRGGAGVEMVRVGQTLDAVRNALEAVHQNLAGSGSDFTRRLEEASEKLSRMIDEAARNLGGSASGAAGALENAMAGVAQKLEAQSAAFTEALRTLQADSLARAEASARTSLEASEAAAQATRHAAQEAAEASSSAARQALETMRHGMDDIVSKLGGDIGRLSDTLNAVNAAFAGQTREIEAVSARSRDTADAFGRIASDVRSATQPLLTQSDKIATATERAATSIDGSVGALSSTEQATRMVAEQLSAHLTQIAHVWDQYEARFKSVDEDLGNAAERFHAEVSSHQEAMREFVRQIDEHTGAILGKINGAVSGLGESVEALNETLDGFLSSMAPRQAAE